MHRAGPKACGMYGYSQLQHWTDSPSSVRLQVVAQDQHVGSHLFAGCALLGQLVLGIVWAGLMVSTFTSPVPRCGD